MIVMVFGTFDILHKGHLDFFRQARQKTKMVAAGFSLRSSPRPKLIVVIARDINVKKLKGYLPKFSEKKRLKNVKKTHFVNHAILGDKSDFFKAIKREKPNVICLGYDQGMKVKILKDKLRALGLTMKVFRLKAYKPQIYKSSKFRNLIKSHNI